LKLIVNCTFFRPEIKRENGELKIFCTELTIVSATVIVFLDDV